MASRPRNGAKLVPSLEFREAWLWRRRRRMLSACAGFRRLCRASVRGSVRAKLERPSGLDGTLNRAADGGSWWASAMLWQSRRHSVVEASITAQVFARARGKRSCSRQDWGATSGQPGRLQTRFASGMTRCEPWRDCRGGNSGDIWMSSARLSNLAVGTRCRRPQVTTPRSRSSAVSRGSVAQRSVCQSACKAKARAAFTVDR
jgi:hypothetical protein